MRHESNNARHNSSPNFKKIAEGIGATAMVLTLAGTVALAVADKVSDGKTTEIIHDRVPLARFAADMFDQMTTEKIELEQNPERARNINEIEPLYYEDENGRNIEFQFCSLDVDVMIDEEAFLEQISKTCELADEKYGYVEFECQQDFPLQQVMYVFCDTEYINTNVEWDYNIDLVDGKVEDTEQFRKFFTDENIEGESNKGASMRFEKRNIDIVLIPTNQRDLTYHHTIVDSIFDSQTIYSASSVSDYVTLVAGHEVLHVVTDKQADDNIKVDPDRIQSQENNLDSISINDKVVFYIGENSRQNDETTLIIDK